MSPHLGGTPQVVAELAGQLLAEGAGEVGVEGQALGQRRQPQALQGAVRQPPHVRPGQPGPPQVAADQVPLPWTRLGEKGASGRPSASRLGRPQPTPVSRTEDGEDGAVPQHLHGAGAEEVERLERVAPSDEELAGCAESGAHPQGEGAQAAPAGPPKEGKLQQLLVQVQGDVGPQLLGQALQELRGRSSGGVGADTPLPLCPTAPRAPRSSPSSPTTDHALRAPPPPIHPYCGAGAS